MQQGTVYLSGGYHLGQRYFTENLNKQKGWKDVTPPDRHGYSIQYAPQRGAEPRREDFSDVVVYQTYLVDAKTRLSFADLDVLPGLGTLLLHDKAVYVLGFNIWGSSVYEQNTFNTLAEIRSNPRSRGCPVILVAGGQQRYDRKRGKTGNAWPAFSDKAATIFQHIRKREPELNIVEELAVDENGGGMDLLVEKILSLMTDRKFWIPIDQPFLTLQKELRAEPFIFMTRKELVARAINHGVTPARIPAALQYLCTLSPTLLATNRNFSPAREPPYSFGKSGRKLMTNKTDPLDVLHVEIQQMIFNQLDVHTILNAESVSKKWNSLCRSDAIWDRLVQVAKAESSSESLPLPKGEPTRSKRDEFKELVETTIFIETQHFGRLLGKINGYPMPTLKELEDKFLVLWANFPFTMITDEGSRMWKVWRPHLLRFLEKTHFMIPIPNTEDSFMVPIFYAMRYRDAPANNVATYPIRSLPWAGVFRIATEFLKSKDKAADWAVSDVSKYGMGAYIPAVVTLQKVSSPSIHMEIKQFREQVGGPAELGMYCSYFAVSYTPDEVGSDGPLLQKVVENFIQRECLKELEMD